MGVSLNAQEQIAHLEGAHTGIITTLRRDGWPVSLPVWFAVLNGRVYLSSPSGAAKLKRVRHDPRCSFLAESGKAWVDLIAVEFRAHAVVLPPGAESAAAEEALWRKYDAFRPPTELLPDVMRQHYGDQVIIRLDQEGDAISWSNAKVRLKAHS